MKAIQIIGRLREKYSNKYTQTPNKDKEHYIKWLQDEYAELAMNQANGAHLGNSNCNILSGWLDFQSNKELFKEEAKKNCLCKFECGTVIRYDEDHPMEVMTHFKLACH